MLAATLLAEDAHFWFLGLRRTARLLLNRAVGARHLGQIVDCGAGTGRNLDWLADYGFAVGVELTEFGRRQGRARGRRLIGGSVAALPFRDGSTDLATSFDVLYCLDDETEAAALHEMWRVLKPGGLVLVNVAALDVLKGSHSALTHEVRRYTKPRVVERLTRTGFTVERVTFTNMTAFPPALAIRTIERLTGRAGEPSENDLRVPAGPINSVMNMALTVEAQVLRLMDLPIGTSIMALARKRTSGY